MARTRREGCCLALDGVRIGIVAGSLITGVRAGPGRLWGRLLEELPMPTMLRGVGKEGDVEGELEASFSSRVVSSGTTPP